MSVWVLYQIDHSLASIRQLTKGFPPSLAARDHPPGPAGSARPDRGA